MKITISCQDNYEAQKLASLIFIKEGKETYIKEILNVVDNELVVSLKDKSAHSILLENNEQVEFFADFVQSVLESTHKILDTKIIEDKVEILKG